MKMTEKKLRKMLKRLPMISVVVLTFFHLPMAITFVTALCFDATAVIRSTFFDMWSGEQITTSLFKGAIDAAGSVFSLVGVIRAVKWLAYLKRNGKKSIRSLESRGLLDKAVDEYNNSIHVVCSAVLRQGLAKCQFQKRKNFISDNYIYIFTENRVLTFDEVARFEVMHRHLDDRGAENGSLDDDDVYYIVTETGQKHNLMVVNGRKYSEDERTKIDLIIQMLREKKPNCCIDMELKYKNIGMVI